MESAGGAERARGWLGDALRRLENLSPGGQGLLEYTLILLLIALAIIVTFVVMGPQVGAVVSNVSKVLGQ